MEKKAAEKGGGYSEDLLNKIQYQMSKDCVLILKNLEVIYPSLYELFNQNYIKIGDKYFSRIAFASSKAFLDSRPIEYKVEGLPNSSFKSGLCIP